jgi:Tfp pilus assembly protein PilN
MDTEGFLLMIVSFTGAAVIGVWAIALAVAYTRRAGANSGTPSTLITEELDAIRARLADLEQRDGRVAELEERLDFLERALGRFGEAKKVNPGS